MTAPPAPKVSWIVRNWIWFLALSGALSTVGVITHWMPLMFVALVVHGLVLVTYIRYERSQR